MIMALLVGFFFGAFGVRFSRIFKTYIGVDQAVEKYCPHYCPGCGKEWNISSMIIDKLKQNNWKSD